MSASLLSTPAGLSQSTLAVSALPKYYFHALVAGSLSIAAWEFLGLDVPFARLSFDAASQSFPWRNHVLTTTVLHSGLKLLLVCGVLCGLLVAFLPNVLRSKVPVLGRVSRVANVWLFLMVVLPAVVVSGLKSQSLPYCPWDEAVFSGQSGHYQWWQPVFERVSASLGKCWPAGHASAGFGVVGTYFFARHYAPRFAIPVLIGALCLGTVMGLAQQVRGAHFMSHTLWTAWITWACCGLTAPPMKKIASRHWRN